MSLLLSITPSDLGLPPKFLSFRPAQAEALEWLLASEYPFLGANAPPGVGKSLLGVARGRITQDKTVYLTSTKSLQAQIQSDFQVIGMKDMRGRANYPCRVYTTKLHKNVSCDYGNEHDCFVSGTTECPYFQAYETAKASPLISTNYAYWLHSRANSPTSLTVDNTPPIELLICDEAHHAVEELSRYLRVDLLKEEYDAFPPSRLSGSGLLSEPSGLIWRNWAEQDIKIINLKLRHLRDIHGSLAEAKREDDGDRVRSLEQSKAKRSAIVSMTDNWVWETTPMGVSFECIWPGQYSHLLWSGVPRIVLLSATLFPYTLQLLGLPASQYEFRQFSNGWPPQNALTYFLPTVKLSYKSSEADYRKLITQIDDIIDSRSDRKGIIHTISYSRMHRILEGSRHRNIMFTNQSSGDAVKTADRFRAAKPPAVLVSPSYGTGWDFPYTQCEYQIIPKVPFPYAESRVMKERCKDQKYRTYMAILEMAQMIGRGRRAPDDRCETFILDGHFPMVMAMGKSFCAKGFTFHRISTIPAKPKKIG